MRPLDFPTNIQIETTSRCNAKCNFCPYPETSKTQPQGVMDEDLFQSIVEQISHHQVQLIQPFLNNDPLMDKRIVPRLETILRKNPRSRVCITTNGFLLREHVADALAAMPLDKIHISSNGLTNPTYDETMGIRGSVVLKNVNYLADQLRRRGSTTELVVTAVLMKANRLEIEHMREYWQARGVAFYLNPLNDRAGNIEADRFAQMLPFSDWVNESQTHCGAIRSCSLPFTFMGILWNGDMVRCCMDWRRAKVLGNAAEDTLERLWHGPRYEALRHASNTNQLHTIPLCDECGARRFSVDADVMHKLLDGENGAGEEGARDAEVLAVLESFRNEKPELIQLGLMR